MADLTTLAVEKMKAGPVRREVPDGRVRGLYLVVQPSGSKSWAYRYRAAGAPRKLTLGNWPSIDLAAARVKANEAYNAVQNNEDPAAQKQERRQAAKAARVAPPIERDLVERVAHQFVERYCKANTRESSWRETDRILKREVLPTWGARHLASIKRADVHELLDGVVDRGSPVMANRVLAAVRKMCGWAVERGLIETSPCDKVKAPSAERSRDRVLSDDELRRFWTACDAIGWPFGPLFKLLALTGQRRDEVGRMKWTELDLEQRVWTLPRERAKNDVQHVVPLSDQAMAILKDLPRVGDHVFSTNARNPVSGFANAKERLDVAMGPELTPFVLHDLRRTAATGMARLGTALPVVEKILNHTSGTLGGIVAVYQRHDFANERRHALDAWGAHVERLATMRPGGNVVPIKAAG